MDSEDEGSFTSSLSSDATEAFEFASDEDDEPLPPPELEDRQALYQSLRIDPASEIRTAKILPGRYGEEIECELEVVPRIFLEEISVNAEYTAALSYYGYEALSYSWGNWADHKWIKIRGVAARFAVTKNLHAALQRLRPEENWRRLWIDQICIDQDSINERNHQVPLMRTIYRVATRVLVWLGEAGSLTPESQANIHADPASCGKYLEAAIRDTYPPCWTRVWVVQEVAVSRDPPVLLVGPLELSWVELHSAHTGEDWLGDSHLSALQKSLELFRVASSGTLRDIASAAHIILRTNSSDPRDKVYALLGLFDSSRGLYIQPDYDQDVADTFIEATKASILSTGALEVLAFAGHNRNHDSALPSWVFDCSMTLDGDTSLVVSYRKNRPLSWTQLNPYQVVQCRFGDRDMTLTGLRFQRLEYRQDLTSSVKSMVFSRVADEDVNGLISVVHDHTARRTSQIHPYYRLQRKNRFKHPAQDSMLWDLPSERSKRCFNVTKALCSRYNKPSREGFDDVQPPLEKRDIRFLFTIYLCASFWSDSFINANGEVLKDAEVYGLLLDQWWMFYFETFRQLANGQRECSKTFFETESGFLGMTMCDDPSENNDWIVLPYGSAKPLVLRDTGSGTWEFRGLAFIHGIMRRELEQHFQDLGLEEMEFQIV